MSTRWMTTAEAAKILGCSERTVRRRATRGELLSKTVDNPGHGRGGKMLLIDISPKDNSEKITQPKDTEPKVNNVKKYLPKDRGEQGKEQVPKDRSANTVTSLQNVAVKPKDGTVSRVLPKDTPTDPDTSPDWIPLSEAANLLGVKRQSLDERAKTSNWPVVKHAPQGQGCKQYLPAAVLPQPDQDAWREKQLARRGYNLPAAVAAEQKEFNLLPDYARLQAIARWNIVKSYRKMRTWARTTGVKLGDLDATFAAQAPVELGVDLETLNLSTLSISAVKKWDKLLQSHGCHEYPVCLADKRKGRAGRPKRNSHDVIKTDVWKMIKVNPTINASEALAEINVRHATNPYNYRTIAAWVQEAKKDLYGNALLRGVNSSSYKNIRSRVHRQKDVRPGERWESDGKRMNNFVWSPFYAHISHAMRMVVRPQLVLWRDVASGLLMAPVLGFAENTHMYMTSLRYAMLDFGIPKAGVTDNAGAANNPITNTEYWAQKKTQAGKTARSYLANGWRGAYAEFGVEPHFTQIGNPQSKNLEPAWGFTLGRFEKTHSVYTGRNIQEREELFRMTNLQLVDKWGHLLMTWESYYAQLCAYIDEYNNTPRPSLERLNGAPMTPLEYYNCFSHPRANRAELEEKLLRWPGLATVRQGEVLTNARYYHHEDFGLLNGQQINCYYDETQIDKIMIGTAAGQVLPTPAQVTLPSSYADKEQFIKALKQQKRMEIRQAKRYVEANSLMIDDLATENAMIVSIDKLIAEQDSIQDEEKSRRDTPNLLANYGNKPPELPAPAEPQFKTERKIKINKAAIGL